MAGLTPIVIRPATQEAKGLWAKALELAEALGPVAEWTLVGGLMVQLYAFEHGDDARPTTDIDVLGDSRRRPAMTQQIAKAIGKFVTFQVPGGTQALQRTEVVLASLEGGPSIQLRRPDLLGAILIKAVRWPSSGSSSIRIGRT